MSCYYKFALYMHNLCSSQHLCILLFAVFVALKIAFFRAPTCLDVNITQTKMFCRGCNFLFIYFVTFDHK
jgi:hypothetical protein